MMSVVYLEGSGPDEIARQLALLSLNVRARRGAVLSVRRGPRQPDGALRAAVVCELP